MPPVLVHSVPSTIHAGPLALTQLETAVLALCVAVALFSTLRLWRIAQRERLQPRLEALRGAASAAAEAPVKRWYGWFGSLVASSPLVGRTEQRRLIDVLGSAGIRRQGSLAVLVATKVCVGVGFTLLAWLGLEWRQWFVGSTLVRAAVLLLALVVGWRLPDFVVARFAARRRRLIEQGMPDALDLLVVCAEGGLSLDQAIDEVGRELGFSHPEIADELALTAAEMRVAADRTTALENLMLRTRVESLRSISAILIQAIRFGTPLADSLRVLAAEMRNARLLRIEERAARLPVLLTIPLVGFILPAMFIVIGTPLVLRLYDFFLHFHVGGGIP
jgi:tight adherence protein C